MCYVGCCYISRYLLHLLLIYLAIFAVFAADISRGIMCICCLYISRNVQCWLLIDLALFTAFVADISRDMCYVGCWYLLLIYLAVFAVISHHICCWYITRGVCCADSWYISRYLLYLLLIGSPTVCPTSSSVRLHIYVPSHIWLKYH